MKEAAVVRAEPGEVLILFRDGVTPAERRDFLDTLFRAEFLKDRYLDIKRETNDGAGVVLAVPQGWEDKYVEQLGGGMRWQIQFAQRHHAVHARRTISAGH